MNITYINEKYRVSFVDVALDKRIELMCEALLLMLDYALKERGVLLLKADLSPGYGFEVYDIGDNIKRINIYKKGL